MKYCRNSYHCTILKNKLDCLFQTFQLMGLSPGEHSKKYAEQCSRKRKYYQEHVAKPSSKRRRLELKKERSTTQGSCEVLEGDSYQQGVYSNVHVVVYISTQLCSHDCIAPFVIFFFSDSNSTVYRTCLSLLYTPDTEHYFTSYKYLMFLLSMFYQQK